MLVLAAILRLGFVANFISEPVLIGFKAGIGVVIVVDQVPKILGIHFARGTFVQNLFATVHGIPETSLATLAVGVSMIVLLILLEHFAPKSPAPLIAVGCGIAAAYLFSLKTHGVELVGHIPQGLPPFTVPDLSLANRLWPGALGIALMSFTETIAAGRAFARNDEPSPQPNRELLATGLRQCWWRFLGCDAGRRRHHADRGQSTRRGTHATGGDRNCGDGAGDNAFPGSAHWHDAASHISGNRDRVFLRTDQALPSSAKFLAFEDRVSVGPRRLRWRRARRHTEGNHCRHHRFPCRAGVTRWPIPRCTFWGASPEPTYSGPAAGASRGRDFSRPVAAEARRPDILRQRRADRTKD